MLDNPTIEIVDGHIVTHLVCKKCGKKGSNTYGKMDFELLGKDKEGFMYFKCPDCKAKLQYDALTGNIKAKKGFWGRFK